MLYLVNWLVVALLIGLWSTLMWLATAILQWTLGGAGALKAEGVVVPQALRDWLPAELLEPLRAAAGWLLGLLDALSGAIPALAQGLSVLSWTVWGAGTVLLLLLGAVTHAGLWFWRSKRRLPLPGAAAFAAYRN